MSNPDNRSKHAEGVKELSGGGELEDQKIERRIIEWNRELNAGRATTFHVDQAGHVLRVRFCGRPGVPKDRRIAFDCDLPCTPEEAFASLDRLRSLSVEIGSGTPLSEIDRAWLAGVLLNVYLNASTRNAPSWDIRQALGLPTSRGRRNEAQRRNLYLSLDVELLRKVGRTGETGSQAIADEYGLTFEQVHSAWKDNHKIARSITGTLVEEDEARGYSIDESVKDFREGLAPRIFLAPRQATPGKGEQGIAGSRLSITSRRPLRK